MTRHKLYNYHPKNVRDTLNLAIEISDQIRETEQELIFLLREIDQKRLYIRYGNKSLLGFCKGPLRFSRVQAQRIATLVRKVPHDQNEAFHFTSIPGFTDAIKKSNGVDESPSPPLPDL